MKVKSLRDIHLRSLSGHTAVIKANVVTEIPDVCAKEAFAQGCVAVEEAAASTPAPAPVVPPAVTVPVLDERANRIHAAIDELIAQNDRGNFKPDGTPKHQAVAKLVGIVSNAEIEQVWSTMTAPAAE